VGRMIGRLRGRTAPRGRDHGPRLPLDPSGPGKHPEHPANSMFRGETLFSSPSSRRRHRGSPIRQAARGREAHHHSRGRRRRVGEWGRSRPTPARSRARVQSACRTKQALKSPAPSIPRGRGTTMNLSRFNYAGETTTKRRGSSPSERVTTDLFSVSESWMALRSAADIGSRARSSPDSTTSWAT